MGKGGGSGAHIAGLHREADGGFCQTTDNPPTVSAMPGITGVSMCRRTRGNGGESHVSV